MKQQKHKKYRLLSKPPQDFYARPEMHILCGGNIQIEKCGKILAFSAEHLELSAGHYAIAIYGTKLVISSLAGQSLIISGKIQRVEFALLQGQSI